MTHSKYIVYKIRPSPIYGVVCPSRKLTRLDPSMAHSLPLLSTCSVTGNVLGFRDYGTECENHRSAEEAAKETEKLSKYLHYEAGLSAAFPGRRKSDSQGRRQRSSGRIWKDSRGGYLEVEPLKNLSGLSTRSNSREEDVGVVDVS